MNSAINRSLAFCSALVLAQPLLASTLPDLTNLDCVIEPFMQVELGSRVDGILDSVLVDRGDTVKANSIVAQLESSVEEAAVNGARARAELEAEIRSHEVNLAFGRRNQKRITELHAKKVVAFHEIDRVETETKVALYNLLQAKENKTLAQLDLDKASAVLNRHTIRSPINGVVVDRYLNPGESVEEKAIVKLAQIDPLRVEVIAPVALFGQIEKGRSANVYPESPIGGEYLSTVEVADPVLDAASGTFRIRLTLPNPEHKLTSGLRCKVSFLDDTSAKTAGLDTGAEITDQTDDSEISSAAASAMEPPDMYSKKLKPVGYALRHHAPALPRECLSIGPIESREEADSLVYKLTAVAGRIVQRDEPYLKTRNFMVLTTEQKTPAEARNLVRTMRKKGIKDLWIIPHGSLTGHVSLGLYKSKAYAEKRQSQLANLGFVTDVRPDQEETSRMWLDFELNRGVEKPASFTQLSKTIPAGLSLSEYDCEKLGDTSAGRGPNISMRDPR